MFPYLKIIIETINLLEVEHTYLIFNAKASPVAKYLVDSIDVRNHIIIYKSGLKEDDLKA